MAFQFELNQAVVIRISGEKGTVDGRAEYANTPPLYRVKYVNGQGLASEGWFDGPDLQHGM